MLDKAIKYVLYLMWKKSKGKITANEERMLDEYWQRWYEEE